MLPGKPRITLLEHEPQLRCVSIPGGTIQKPTAGYLDAMYEVSYGGMTDKNRRWTDRLQAAWMEMAERLSLTYTKLAAIDTAFRYFF